jgi:hypothetical protein
MTLEEAVADIEALFDCADGPVGPYDAEGRPYVVIDAGGVKEEGEPHNVLCTNIGIAVSLWRRAILDAAARCRAAALALDDAFADPAARICIRWRVRPELDFQEWVQKFMDKDGKPILDGDGEPMVSRIPIFIIYSRFSMYAKLPVKEAA